MNFSVEQYAHALYHAVRETKDADKVIENLLSLLKSNNDIPKFEAVVKAYEKLEHDDQGIQSVTAEFAHNSEEGKKLLESLNLIAGKMLNVTVKENPDLIGGVVIKYDDVLIDASVKGQLERLRNQLIK
ncbi:MAG TPA: ATP synthase F1 subunit delta [Patescibacteria group bacterium]|nr:ATP synthase F1 subunit delta [Patescibacteria group bacterium]